LAKQDAKQEAAKPLTEAAKVADKPVASAIATDPREQRKQEAQARQQLAQTLRPFKRELEQVEQRMAALNTERHQLEQRMAQPMTPADIAEAGRSLKTCTDTIASLEERWLELSEQIEAHS
jgi:ATP-binding cassette, subfamily F, member 3